MKQHSLFHKDKEIITKNKQLLENESYKNSLLYDEFAQLTADYSKLFTQFSRIVKISDKTQVQLKESREAIIKYNEELKQLNATKDKFFSIIAHDLKSPFQAFLNLNTFLVKRIDRYNKQEIAEVITEVGNTAENLFKLLENLLSWSRIQMGKTEFAPNRFPVAQLVDLTLEVLSTAATHKKINLETRIPETVFVYADPNMFSTILRNLVSNAIKFTTTGGTVCITAKQEGAITEIAVSDTGVGIKEKDLAKLFRIDLNHSTPGTADEKGTGLGLILCKEMVDKHQGEIGVESKPGFGTTFYIRLRSTFPNTR
jgi:signal transduction histidine kinase